MLCHSAALLSSVSGAIATAAADGAGIVAISVALGHLPGGPSAHRRQRWGKSLKQEFVRDAKK